jgi:hypothetical protein
LAPDDRDAVVDLSAAMNRAYQQGAFKSRIDYGRDPAVPLRDEDRAWLADLLKDRRPTPRRGEAPPAAEHGLAHEDIAAVAYEIWLGEGRPPGRDREHWFAAIDWLRRGKQAGKMEAK